MASRGPVPWSLHCARRFQCGWQKSRWRCATSLCLKRMKKTGYNWFEGEVVQEGNAVDTDADNGDDFNEMENLFDGVLGNDNDEDDDDYNAIADNDINS